MDLKVSDDFACSCHPRGARRCALLLRWAYRYLDHDGGWDTPTGPSNFLSRVVYTLEQDYSANIEMWAAIVTETHHPKEPKPEFSTYVQCDELEHGLALTLRLYYKRYGKQREW
jgi:hypothetical protein